MAVGRVALVSPYALSVPGGAQGQVRGMARELARRGADVTVCSPGDHDASLDAAGVHHVAVGAVVRVPANGSRAPVTLSPRASRHVAAAVASLEGCVVHVHEPFAPVAAYATLRAHRRPTVATFHRGGGGPAYTLGAPVIRRLARGIDVSTAVSARAAETILLGAGLDAAVLFNGLELDDVARGEPSATTAPTVLFVGRHEERKGLAVLLEALQLLEGPLECWVLGDGPQTGALRRRFAADRRIAWLGARDDTEKYARLRGADVLCVPSLGGESFGLVPLEGMAARTAVVASDIDGYREATGGHATLVPPGDRRALADALCSALRTPAAPARLDAARTYAAGWSMHALVERYLECYEAARERFGARDARK